jgi:copper transport protein
MTRRISVKRLMLVPLMAMIAVTTGLTPAGRDGPTRLHIELESSAPADGDTVRAALDGITLVFSAAVESRLSSVRWVSEAGDTVSLRVSADPERPEALVTDAPPGENGNQKLVWRTVSADGHQVAGEISFVVAAAEFVAPAAAAIVAAPDAVVSETVGAESASASSEYPTSRIVARGLGMFCLLGFAGLLWFGFGTTMLDEPGPHRIASILGMTAVALLAVDLLLWTTSLRLPGVGLGETLAIVGDTRSGAVEIWRTGLAGIAFLLFTGTGLGRLGSVLAMTAVVIGSLGGHQATIEPMLSLPANALHLGAAAVWTGGLLLVSTWPADAAIEPHSGWTMRRVVRRVSSAALLASGVILITALAQDLILLPSLGAIFSSEYGKLLLVKSAGFAALIGFGAYNRFRLIPALEADEAAARPLRRSVRLEVVVVIVTVLVAVALAQVPPPGA